MMILMSACSVMPIALGAEPVLLELLRDQVVAGDVDLLLEGVAGQLEDLHAVAERAGDRVEQVRRRDEHHLRQVVRRRRGSGRRRLLFCSGSSTSSSAARRDRRGSPRPSLSISSSMKTGLIGPGLLHRLDDPAGQRADVGAPVAADLGLVAHAAERDAHELAARGARRWTGRARSCRRREGRRSRGSAPACRS